MKALLRGLLVIAAGVTVAHAERPTVIELFTAQGCSSCPPAEALLGELRQKPGVLALAYHVDYWDQTGWKDRFALPIAAQRQSQYSKQLKLRVIATPQMIIDGKAEVLGTSHERLHELLSSRENDAVAVHVTTQQDTLNVDVDEAAGNESLVLLIAYLPEATTSVTRGENAGRSLHEFNIVRFVRRLGTWKGPAAHWSVDSKALPEDATWAAALVQDPHKGRIIGAASVALR